MIVKDKHQCFTKFDREPGECLDFKEVPNVKIKKKNGRQLVTNILLWLTFFLFHDGSFIFELLFTRITCCNDLIEYEYVRQSRRDCHSISLY